MSEEQERLRPTITAGDYWAHVRSGKVYCVVCLAVEEANEQPVVIYQSTEDIYQSTEDDRRIWSRPKDQWLDRFIKVKPPAELVRRMVPQRTDHPSTLKPRTETQITPSSSARDRYLRPGFRFAATHLVEEFGEVLAAYGKLMRFGPYSVNPEDPELIAGKKETNIAWFRRELGDVEAAIVRLRAEITRVGELDEFDR